MALGNWFKRKRKPDISVWAVKQIDEDLLHLCGQATIETKGTAAELMAALEADTFHGAVRMRENGQILNAAQFAALIPDTSLDLVDERTARWRNRQWHIAWTPQRCWLHTGPLTIQPSRLDGQTRWVSIEDVSGIRAKAQSPHPASRFYGLQSLTTAPSDAPRRSDRESDD
ncbi:hypothetical protein [Modicisalibacter coralii]|uniref:hypothetical protein n=1 Tax=Modicisalibacter coralii TaxID=2304602 RepID=UPI00100BF2C2|nr:hypothetical protein [Halomonas coralii]